MAGELDYETERRLRDRYGTTLEMGDTPPPPLPPPPPVQGPPVAHAGAPEPPPASPAPPPYQPNPGLPGYQPNPGIAPLPVSADPVPIHQPLGAVQNIEGPPSLVMGQPAARKPPAMPPMMPSLGGGLGPLQTTSRTVHEGTKLTDETKQANSDLERASQESTAAQTEHGAAKAEAENAKLNRMVTYDQLANVEARQQKRLSDQRKADEYARVQKAFDDVTNHPMQTRSQLWANRSTPDRLLGTAAIFAGGFTAGFRGTGKNSALEIINKQLDDEAADQKSIFDQKRGKLEDAKTLYEIGRKNGLDEDQALLAARISARDEFSRMLDAQASNYTLDSAQKAEAAKLKEAMARGTQSLRLELNKLTADKIDRHETRPAIGGGGVGGAPGGLLSSIKLDSTHVRLPDGTWVKAPDEKAADELRQQTAAIGTIEDKAKRIKELASHPWDTTEQQMDAAKQDFILTLKQAAGPGFSSDKDMALLKEAAGLDASNASLYLRQNMGSGLKGLEEAVKTRKAAYENQVKSAGYPIVQTGSATDARGIPHSVAIERGDRSDTWRQPLEGKFPRGASPKGVTEVK